MTYYAYHCGHEGTRYSNIKKCPQCGQQWKRKTELMLEAYPNISPDHMESAVRQIIRHTLTIDCDGVHNQWRCDLHDGHTVLVSESVADIEAELDRLENEGRLNTEVQGDAGTESEEAAVHRDWRGAEQD